MKIIDIKIDEKELNIHLAQKSGHVSRKEFIRKHTCNSCDQWATKLIKYQVGDKYQKITRIERYCDLHFGLIINKHYSDKTKRLNLLRKYLLM